MKKAIIVLPTYHEKENVKVLIPQIFTLTRASEKWDVHILVVDDKSPDGTSQEIRKLQKKFKNLHLIEGEKQGLGTAYVRGFTYALKQVHADVIFEMDADCQHPPDLIPKFLTALEKGADFVIGSRYIRGGSIPEQWTADRKFYSIMGNLIARFGFMSISVHDWTSGFRAMKSSFLKEIISDMHGYNGYVFQIALLDKARKKGLKIVEVPLQFIERFEGSSKFNPSKYILESISYIVSNSPFIKFVIVGLVGFVIDFSIAVLLITTFDMFKPHANAISAEIAIVSNFVLNNFWSFSHKKIDHSTYSYISKFTHFNVISSGSILIQWFGMFVTLHIFGDKMLRVAIFSIPSWIIYKMFIIAFLIIPYSYVMYNYIIWNNSAKA